MKVVLNVGTGQVEITPWPGIELAGFAKRPQPSTEVLDPLFVRALYLENGTESLLWLHADLLAIDQELADRIRGRVQTDLNISSSHVLVSASHTHSGPATFDQNGVGRKDPDYVRWLEKQFQKVAALALVETEPCTLVVSEGICDLGLDRRKRASAHTDKRVLALGWKRAQGSFKAVLVNYSMHPVGLRDSWISADWPGSTARNLSECLPGRPLAIVTTGACGNVNPPQVGATPAQVFLWGEVIANCVVDKLLQAKPETVSPDQLPLRVFTANLDLPLEPWGVAEIEENAALSLADADGHAEFGDKYTHAVEAWRSTMIQRCERRERHFTQAVLGVVCLGRTTLLTLNAEVFSKFTELAGEGFTSSLYTIGCTNGIIGYLPPEEAYDEGAYEVLWSMFFYNMPRPRRGGFELLAKNVRDLLASSVPLTPALIRNQPNCLNASLPNARRGENSTEANKQASPSSHESL
jgi:neutral ceramidase